MLRATIQHQEVKIEISMLLAGLPGDRQALEYLAAHPEKDGGFAAKEVLLENEGQEGIEEETQRSRCVFRRMPNGKPAVDEHHIRAFIRDTLAKLGINKKAPWRGFWMNVYTTPRLIPVEGEECLETRAFKTGYPNYASIVVIHEAVKNAQLSFVLEIHGNNNKVSLKDLEYIFNYGGRYVGFGPAKLKSMSEIPYGIFTKLAIS